MRDNLCDCLEYMELQEYLEKEACIMVKEGKGCSEKNVMEEQQEAATKKLPLKEELCKMEIITNQSC